MRVSVIVCTWNRAQTLVQVLEGLDCQAFDREDAEVIVVDNNSTDWTRDAVAMFAAQSALPVRYIFEENQGLSRARNRGIGESRGEVVAFLDDDAIPEPDWLEKLIEPYRDWQVGCVGGRVLLHLADAKRPAWLTPIFDSYLSAYGREGQWPVAVTQEDFPYGANISFRREALDEVGFFNATLGFSGQLKVGGEETEMCERLYRHGWKVMYAPGAEVTHLVPKERLTKNYLLTRARGSAASNVLMNGAEAGGASGLAVLCQCAFLLLKHLALCLKNINRRDWRFFFWLYVVRELSSIKFVVGEWRSTRADGL